MKRIILVLFGVLLCCGVAATGTRAQTPAACCSITAIDARTGVVSAKVNANQEVFEFRVPDAKVLAGLHAGQAVYANFTTKQISLDGKKMVGTITSLPQASSGAKPGPGTPPANSARPPMTQLPVVTLAVGTAQRSSAPATANANPPRVEARTLTAAVNGQSTSAHLVNIRGLDGIEQAQGLPDGVKELLMMHVKTLAEGESDHYIVNADLANEWSKTHPVPATLKQTAVEKNSHTGCKSFSMHCAGEVGKHAEGQADALIKEAKGDWDHAANQLGHEWNVAANLIEGCFADQHTNPINIPADFTIHLPSLITLDSKDVNAVSKAVDVINAINSGQVTTDQVNAIANATGSNSPLLVSSDTHRTGPASPNADKNSDKKSPWSQDLNGRMVFGLPLLSSQGTAAHIDFFYIPCLPFFIRPRSLGVSGSMSVEAAISGNAILSGKNTQFTKTVQIPPVDLHVPLAVLPIVIPPSGPPVAELDISFFVQGSLKVSGKGELTTNFNLDYAHSTGFDLLCDGKGCKQKSEPHSQLTNQPPPPPTTASSSSKLSAQLQIQPTLFTGIEFNTDYDLLTVRAGPEPQFTGDVQADACLTVASGKSPTSSEALAAELEWTPSVRADVLVATKAVGTGYNHPLLKQLVKFWDLTPGGSPAFMPSVSGPKQLKPGSPGIYNLKMPACYPYSDPVQYQVSWTGGVTPVVTSPGPTPGTKACAFPAKTTGEATCWFDPKKDLAMSFAWPKAGDSRVTVVVVGDQFGRKFASAKPVVSDTAVK